MQLKKILIAGDGFSADKLKPALIKDGNNGEQWSWINLLKEKYQITNESFHANSINWIYKTLIKYNLNDFDKVVILVPDHSRLTIQNKTSDIMSISNYKTVINRLNIVKENSRFYEELIWAKKYYETYYNEDIELIVYEAILNKIIKLVSNEKLILIPCVQLSNLDIFDKFKVKFPLNDITLKEISYNYDILKNYYRTSKHINNMSIENKTIFAKMIEDLIEKDYTDITLDNFMQINPTDFDTYYKEK